METQISSINDYRSIFLIAFIVLMIGIIPYGLVDSSFPWACFVTSGALFMVGLGMLLNQGQMPAHRNFAVKSNSKPSKSMGKSKPAKIVRKNTPKSKRNSSRR